MLKWLHMNPDLQKQALDVDYLNNIATQPVKKLNLNRRQLVIGGAILSVVVFFITILAVAALSGTSDQPLQRLAARLQTTEKIVGDAQSKLKSTELRTLNSNLKIFLTNTNRDIVAPLADENINTAKLEKTIVTAEAGTDITGRLEDARLNAVFDRTYARELSYQLETITTLIEQIKSSTSSQNLETFLDNTSLNLQPTQKAFAEFNAANG